MKYKDGNTWKEIVIKALDSLPVGTQISYTGSEVPAGWEQVNDYSTSEIDTGKRWVDGKKIYRKVFIFDKNEYSLNSGNNWYEKTITHNLNISTYTNVIGFTKRTNNGQQIIPNGNYGSGLSGWFTSFGDLNTNDLSVRIGVDEYSINSKNIVIIEYTKSS